MPLRRSSVRVRVFSLGGPWSAGLEAHVGILGRRAIQQRRRPALQVALEERQRVRVDDAVRPLDADRSAEISLRRAATAVGCRSGRCGPCRAPARSRGLLVFRTFWGGRPPTPSKPTCSRAWTTTSRPPSTGCCARCLRPPSASDAGGDRRAPQLVVVLRVRSPRPRPGPGQPGWRRRPGRGGAGSGCWGRRARQDMTWKSTRPGHGGAGSGPWHRCW
jgi:hypothetical protein